MNNLSDLKKIILETLAECELYVQVIEPNGRDSFNICLKITLEDKNGNVLLEDFDHLPAVYPEFFK